MILSSTTRRAPCKLLRPPDCRPRLRVAPVWTLRLACAVLGLVAMLELAQAAEDAARPNILLIVADDLGWADVGWHGGQHKTPSLDRLVKEGVELDRHYVQPVCTPTRTALMSGRWTSRFGRHVLSPSNDRAFPLGTLTLGSLLQSQGYTTHVAGKWHLGSKPEWGPNHYGFNHSYGSLAGAVDPWTHRYRPGEFEQTWHRDCKIMAEEGNATELVGAEVVRWIRGAKSPWFVYVPFHAVHVPIDAPDEFKQLYQGVRFYPDPIKDDAALRYAAFVSQLDAKIGQFVAALDETGQRGNTLIVFTSDNGGKTKSNNPYVGAVADSPVLGSNLPLRGEKAQLYEGGIRVCAFANWPGRLAPRRVAEPLHAADWVPTLAGLVGYTPAAEPIWDGRNAWPALTGSAEKLPARAIYIPMPKARVVLEDGWKLIEFDGTTDGDTRRELYQVFDDPSETRELSAEHPEHVERLTKRLSELRQDDLQANRAGD